jgi:hypothetical protein
MSVINRFDSRPEFRIVVEPGGGKMEGIIGGQLCLRFDHQNKAEA